MRKAELKFKQILGVQYESKGRLNGSLYGLGFNGRVYRWDGKCSGWIPYRMDIAECDSEHKESENYVKPKPPKLVINPFKPKIKIVPMKSFIVEGEEKLPWM